MNLGQRIRLLREKAGLKQLDLANAMQVTPQSVSKWERGENYPDIVGLLKMAKILGVSTDYLLGVTDEKPGVFEATVMSTGIRYFARKSAVMDAREVADWANVIFHHLTEAVLGQDGVPIKYVGDGFLCFFSGPNHAERALQAAMHAKRVIQNDDLIITLNSGDIYLGTVGHPDYAIKDICGDTVNVAFLMMKWVGKNCPGGMAVTGSTVKHLTKKYKFKKHAHVFIDLINTKIPIFEIDVGVFKKQED